MVNSTSTNEKFTFTSIPNHNPAFSTISGTFQTLSSSNFQLSIYAIASLPKINSKIVFSTFSISIPCTSIENKPVVAIISDHSVFCANKNQVLYATGAHTYSWYNGSTSSTLIPSVVPGIPISVIGTNTITGCSNHATISLNIKPSPPLTYILSSPSVCLGSTVNIALFGANSYSWCDGALSSARNCTITESQQIYTVTGIGKYGCNSTSVITVIGIPPPTISLLVSKKTASSLDSTTLCTPQNLQVSWLYNNSKNTGNQVVLPSSIRQLTINVVDVFGCTATAEISIPNIASPPLRSKEGNEIYFSNTKNGFSFHGIYGPIQLSQNAKLNRVNCNLVNNTIDFTVIPLADGTYFISNNDVALNWLLIKNNSATNSKE